MNSKLLTCMLAFLFVLFTGCEYKWRFLYLKNNSDQRIHMFPSEYYPDTTLRMSDRLNNDDINPNGTGYLDFGNRREDYVGNLTDGKLVICVVSEDSLEAHGFVSLAQRDMVLKRFVLTRHELENMNWTVEYP